MPPLEIKNIYSYLLAFASEIWGHVYKKCIAMAGTGRGSGMGLMGDKRKIFSLYNFLKFLSLFKNSAF